jgi:transglutaminase-like putative cysteine protease
MQSASADVRLELNRDVVWSRVRASLGGGLAWSAVLVLLLTYAVARSTATADWVTGIDVITFLAVGGAVAMGVLAVVPVPWAAALAAGIVAGPIVASIASWPVLHAAHPTDSFDLALIGIWSTRISDGTAASDPSFYLFLICWLMWITGAWLSWCVLRWRKPMLGLIPGAAAFATNLLNFPTDQNGYTLAILVLTLALLLWTNYTGSIANATRAHVKLTGDARWDFWESGLVAMAGLIVLGIMLPPLSTVDKTVDVESSAFSSWAQLQQRLSHPGIFNSSQNGIGTTGFSSDVKLSGPLQRTRDVVFTYTVVGDYGGPRYFRGLNETLTLGGEWRYASGNGLHEVIAKGEVPLYGEDYQKLALAGFDVKMVRPPIGNADVLFYPSEFYKVDRVTLAAQVPSPPSSSTGLLMSIDRLSSQQPATSLGKYNVDVAYSTATVQDLQQAGTNYPDWLRPQYTELPEFGYRPSDVVARIHNLALDVIRQAGLDPATATPYDEAAAIEAYLRSDKFSYTLQPKTPPPGTDPIDYFLFTSHAAYCEYFATAMGDMLRSIGIPTRLVNGFGPGNFDPTIQSYVVRGEDAHTWVEVYFPGFGWIPFEPTNDTVYQTIPRGASGVPCLRDSNCTDPGQTSGILPGGTSQAPGHSGLREDPGNGSGGPSFKVGGLRFDANALTKIAGVLVAILLLLLALGARYLRPRTVTAVWKRTLALTRLAGAERRPGETPLELGRRWQRTFPEAAEPVGALARGFVVAAYAPPDLASSSRVSVMEAWASLRPLLLRRVFGRLRPGRL